VLSRASLDLRMREQGRSTETFARTLDGASASLLLHDLETERRRTGALQLVAYGRNGELMASSANGTAELPTPATPTELLLQVNDGRPYVSLEPQADGGYYIIAAAPIPSGGRLGGGGPRFVLAVHEVPRQLAGLSEAVQHSYSQYGELALMREPLKTSFQLTLTMVVLLAMLLAIYLAISSAKRLIRPVQDLIEGTRAVGKGDFDTRLPLPSRDEMGSLVHSFNDMTKRLRRASEEATRSRQIVEQERQRLAVLLAGLSTGVMVLDPQLRLRIVNEAAGSILGDDLGGDVGCSLLELGGDRDVRLQSFVQQLAQRLQGPQAEWREQLQLPNDRVLSCACSPLDEAAGEPGFVIVFDDITTLLQAQRDAAWGEVARRLAHEIKNPLTPIQLSAERLRRRLQGHLPDAADSELLERSTHTIVQQVEAMKSMVNAFSEYARAPELRLAPCDIDALVTEVAELYRAQDGGVDIRVVAGHGPVLIQADAARLRQVLNNLVSNAIEAVGGTPGGWVELRTAPLSATGQDGVQLTVSDNGPGFQPQMLARVFDPYVTSKQKGTGLGLAIVKKIIEEHGGRIAVENRSEGGALVRVIVPVAAREHVAQPQRVIA
jgi:nitrogen fixation/metabolism regulation signal transduction histidine kinase